MNKRITQDQLESEIKKMLTDYAADVSDETTDALKEVGKKGTAMVKGLSPVGARRTNKYRDTWTYTMQGNSGFTRGYANLTIHQKNTRKFQNWRLVHLLEKGHMARDGSWVNPVRPHVKPTQDFVDNEAIKEIKKRIENI